MVIITLSVLLIRSSVGENLSWPNIDIQPHGVMYFTLTKRQSIKYFPGFPGFHTLRLRSVILFSEL